MTDSENSTPPPGVTRRAILGAGAALPLAARITASSEMGADASEPVLLLWQDWQQAHAEAIRWCREWQRLETALIRSVGTPRVLVKLPAATEGAWVTTHEDIERELADREGVEELQAGLHAELAARQARWDEAAAKAGLAEIENRDETAWKRRDMLGKAIFAQSAGTLAGVAAKLAVILRTGESGSGDPEFPWPEIRSALSDLCQWTSLPEDRGERDASIGRP